LVQDWTPPVQRSAADRKSTQDAVDAADKVTTAIDKHVKSHAAGTPEAHDAQMHAEMTAHGKTTDAPEAPAPAAGTPAAHDAQMHAEMAAHGKTTDAPEAPAPAAGTPAAHDAQMHAEMAAHGKTTDAPEPAEATSSSKSKTASTYQETQVPVTPEHPLGIVPQCNVPVTQENPHGLADCAKGSAGVPKPNHATTESDADKNGKVSGEVEKAAANDQGERTANEKDPSGISKDDDGVPNHVTGVSDADKHGKAPSAIAKQQKSVAAPENDQGERTANEKDPSGISKDDDGVPNHVTGVSDADKHGKATEGNKAAPGAPGTPEAHDAQMHADMAAHGKTTEAAEATGSSNSDDNSGKETQGLAKDSDGVPNHVTAVNDADKNGKVSGEGATSAASPQSSEHTGPNHANDQGERTASDSPALIEAVLVQELGI